ncbi:PABC domain-containing protein [Caerostris extrusa]|uniref:PABC domain-containing protein n=1 Tax=Caerostris extrusa TaxID=172846 RepID=A0AAV4UGZ0_CAEEX|nr:PABC domain-containing protein [Caerostris extrusa]
MLQFILVLVFMLQLYFYPTCEVSKYLTRVLMITLPAKVTIETRESLNLSVQDLSEIVSSRLSNIFAEQIADMYRNGNKRSRSNRNNNKASKSSTIQPQSFSPYPQYVAAEAVVANFQSVSPYEEIYSCCAEQQQKELIGEELYYYVYQWYPERAGKLTGMLLELDINSLLQMLRDGKFLRYG